MKNPYKIIRMWYLKRRVNRSIRLLDRLDWNLRSIGYTRTQRRQFWREFIKRHDVRTEVLNRMTQQ